jgi:energy-coupling factor transporter transmembrane protein EcfT
MTPDQRAQYQARREADYQTWQADQQRKFTRQKALYVNAPVLLIVGTAFVEALVVLFATQHFDMLMSIVGTYSVLFALILFVQLLTPMVAAIIRNNRRENQKMGPSQPATEDGGLTL